MNDDARWTLDAITRDLDMVVFELERPPADDAAGLLEERRKRRRQLERLRDRLQDLLDRLG